MTYRKDSREKNGIQYSVFKVHRAGILSLASMTIAYRKKTINNFGDISRIFFSFYRAGRFGRHIEPILYSIQRGNGFRRKSTGSFHPARP